MCFMSGVPEEPSSWPTTLGYNDHRLAHADYASPFMSHVFLLMVDTRSEWMEMYLNTITGDHWKDEVHSCYFGLPEQLVTDNSSSFTSVFRSWSIHAEQWDAPQQSCVIPPGI